MPWTRKDCLALDRSDPIAHVRERFVLPDEVIYLDGNSLGALPKTVAVRVAEAIEHEWARGLIRSWNDAGWYRAPQRVGAKIAKLIGAADDEVIVTDSTSVDLFKVLTAALRMRPGRTKILGVVGDFPTDSYIANGVAAFTDARFVRLSAETLVNEIDEDVAVVVLTHVNYRSGFVHDMRALNEAAHAKGALIVWDLSHSAGVLPVGIDAAGADFAVGCGYKYLNGGPGAPAYVFVAKRHQQTFAHPLTGWLGHADPFAFAADFEPAQGMDKLLTGTPPILSLLALDAALDAFDGVDMAQAYAKVQSLTGLFITLADGRLMRHGFTLVSPRDKAQRGAQVALAHPEGYAIMQALIARGLIGDFRAPDIVRFGFAPLYTRHVDVYDAAALIDDVMTTRAWDTADFKARKAVT
jgi:kynureninase